MLLCTKWESPYRHLALTDDRATIDFESRSAANILRVGAWKYSKHKTTRILCLSFRLPGDEDVSLWQAGYFDDVAGAWVEAGMFPGSPRTLEELFDWIRAGGLVESHSAFFERAMWEHIFVKPTPVDEFGCADYQRGVNAPKIKFHQWRCSAAKAAAFGLPRALDEACEALFEESLKDMEGRRVMLRLAKPRPARKGEPKDRLYWHNDTASFLRLFAYCKTDTAAEHRLSAALPDLSPDELKVWQADFKANWRGVRVDVELCKAAIRLDTEIKRRWNEELFRISGIESGTLRAQILGWLQSKRVVLLDTKAATLDALLDGEEDIDLSAYGPTVARVVFIARNINRTSTSKYKRVLEMVDEDDSRVRDLVMYCGAHTGRWAGRGIQVQNFPRGVLKWRSGKDMTMDEAVALVMSGTIEEIEQLYGDVLLLLSSVTRGVLLPSRGRRLICADYSAIEARVVLWLAGCEEALDVFRRGDDLYCDMATSIYRRRITKADTAERFFGKTAILSLGFGVGFLSFCLRLRLDLTFTEEEAEEILGKASKRYRSWVERTFEPKREDFAKGWKYETEEQAKHAYHMAVNTARLYVYRLKANRINDWRTIAHELALCKMVVDKYRERFGVVVEMWAEQESAAVSAIQEPGKVFQAGMILWCVENNRLFGQLPSGRYLTYAKPSIRLVKTPWGQVKPQICFMGVGKTGAKKWTDLTTYGASLVENITQACARDVMAYAFVRADEKEDYTPITTVHDELINEVDEDKVNVQEFNDFMTEVPPAFICCPIAAESGSFTRYQK